MLFGFRSEESDQDPKVKELLEVHDLLVTNSLKEALLKSEELLKNDPLSFDNYYLLAQIRAVTGSVTDCGYPPATIAYEILENLSKIIKNEGNLELPLQVLKNVASKLGDNHLGLSLWQFVEAEMTGDTVAIADQYASIVGKTNAAGLTRNFLADNCPHSISRLIDRFPDSATARLIAFQNGYDCVIRDSAIPIIKPLIHIAEARRAFENGNYEDVVSLLSGLIFTTKEVESIGQLYQMKVVELLFSARMVLGQYLDAASEVVSVYCNNSNNLRHVSFEGLIQVGKEGACDEMIATINWPILALLNNGDEQDVYEAVDEFLSQVGMATPLTYVENIDLILSISQRTLLRDVIVPKVIERSAFWTNCQNEQRELRSAILQKLYETSEEDQELVVNELSSMEEDKILEADYLNVEGPKFVLDFSDVNRRLLPMISAAFDRYLLYKAYEDSGGLVEDQQELFEQMADLSVGSSESRNQPARQGVSSTLLEHAAIGLFGGYLWDSRNSINSTLGTRIRHGSFENQITRAFDSAGLLATKNLDGIYECGDQILEQLSDFPENTRSGLIQAFVSFTELILDLCADLVSTKLRITAPSHIIDRLEKEGLPVSEFAHSEGLLNFFDLFDSSSIAAEFGAEMPLNVGSFTAICRRMFERVASDALDHVRNYLDVTVAPFIVEATEELERVIHNCNGPDEKKALLAHEIAASRDAFSYDIRLIKKWFSVARNIEQISGSFRSLIEMAFKVVNFATSGRLGVLIEDEVADERVEGLSRVMIYEVLLILLRNIVKHSHIEKDQKVTYLLRKEHDGKLVLSLSNYIDGRESLLNSLVEANDCITAGAGNDILAKGSGRTGLKRIPLILGQISSSNVVVVAEDATIADSDPLFKISIKFTL